MKPWRGFLSVTNWLTRVAGAAITVCGISVFVLAWAERSVTPVVMGVITIGIGLVVASIRDTSNGGLEYGLFRPRR